VRRQPVGVALLLVAASATAAAQVRIEAGGTLRAEFHISTHLDWTDFRATPAAPPLEMRRARLGVKGAMFGRLEYEIEHDFRERELGWRDVYADVAFGRAIQIRGGRFKAPFSLDQLTAALEFDLVARSLAAHYLAPGRDTGVMAHGRLFGRRVRFQAAGFRSGGDNVRADERRHAHRDPLLAGRVVFRPWSESKTSELLRGLALGAVVPAARVSTKSSTRVVPAWMRTARRDAGANPAPSTPMS
jgi:phosphate-selective porin